MSLPAGQFYLRLGPELLKLVSQYADGDDVVFAVRTTVFLIFFVATAVALWYNERTTVRRSYIALFLVFLFVPFLLGGTIWPFSPWHLFASTTSTENTAYEFTVVDVNGDEFVYDGNAAEPVNSYLVNDRYGRATASDFTPKEQRKYGCFLLAKADEYRRTLKDRDRWHVDFSFPDHNIVRMWDRSTFESAGEFERLRLYEREIVLTSDGQEVLADERTLLVEYRRDGVWDERPRTEDVRRFTCS
jgi:hypothetical protein